MPDTAKSRGYSPEMPFARSTDEHFQLETLRLLLNDSNCGVLRLDNLAEWLGDRTFTPAQLYAKPGTFWVRCFVADNYDTNRLAYMELLDRPSPFIANTFNVDRCSPHIGASHVARVVGPENYNAETREVLPNPDESEDEMLVPPWCLHLELTEGQFHHAGSKGFPEDFQAFFAAIVEYTRAEVLAEVAKNVQVAP